MVAQVWRAFQPGRGLAGYHLHRMDGALGRPAYRIEPDQGTGGYDDAGAFLLCALDQVAVLQKLRDRERYEDAPLVDRADGNVAEQCRRQTFNHDIAGISELGHPANRYTAAHLRQRTLCLFDIAHGDSGERQTGHAGDQAFRHIHPHGTEAGNTHAQRLLVARLHHDFRPVKFVLRFSIKASTPSAASGVRLAARWRSRSRSSWASSELPAEAFSACLISARPCVGALAKCSHNLCASPAKAASSRHFQINPHCSAFSAESGSAKRAKPFARELTTSRGRNQVPPESGMSPTRAKDWMKLADRAATTMSQASAMLAPAPAATPLTAATTGKARLRNLRTKGL